MHATMKEAKMRPYGGDLSPPEKLGVQLKTKMYLRPSARRVGSGGRPDRGLRRGGGCIEPSKKETTAPQSQIFELINW